jgi:hypothetical protein
MPDFSWHLGLKPLLCTVAEILVHGDVELAFQIDDVRSYESHDVSDPVDPPTQNVIVHVEFVAGCVSSIVHGQTPASRRKLRRL